MKERKNKPMLLLDLGVPRNVEYQVRDLEYAYLFTIEDIEHVTQENLDERSVEARIAKTLIQKRVKALSQDKIKKENRNETYEILRNICESMSDKDFIQLVNADDPYKFLKKIDAASADQLKQISTMNSHAIFSMIQEIRSA